MKTIRVTAVIDGGYERVIVAERIVQFYKDPNARDDGTWVKLDTGEAIFVTESINTLEARIQSLDEQQSSESTTGEK